VRLETRRLILRDYLPGDYDRVHLYASLPEFSRFEMWGPNSEEDTRKFLREMIEEAADPERYEFDLAICLKESGLLIGGCGIGRDGPGAAIACLGWAINPDFQGQGFATEAAARLIRFGFEDLGLQLIYATCDVRNSASYRVMEKLGLKRERRIDQHMMQKGEMRDSYRYEIVNSLSP
jgi:RimJ/RimL family protein N-acetyltransferase